MLVLSLGPVQEFIATARRTRDLFAGSRLLSEAAQRAAEVLADAVGVERLIFPAPEGKGDLEKLGAAGIPNVLLLRVPEGQDPRVLGEKALAAAREYLRGKALEVFRAREAHLEMEAALAQVEDLLEGYYAYAPLQEGYPKTRARVMALLAARKNTRDFAPVTWGKAEFKSSLDGAREHVLRLPKDREQAEATRLSLGLRRGEYLSGPDLLKRWWRTEGSFLSTSHAAVLPFWEGVRQAGAQGLLEEAFKDLAAWVGEAARADTWHPVLRNTPFAHWNVHLLYESRLEEFLALKDEGVKARVQERLKRLWRDLGLKGVKAPPGAYYALLHADGDRMGETIDRQQDPKAHRELSRRQALEFADKVKRIVEAHQGGLVYSGGDDVLALLPLHTALRAAWALARRFRDVVKPYGKPEAPPSLSVGLAVVHHLEPLQDALDLVRRAEKLAKEGRTGEEKRNALVVAYSPRSGTELMVRGRWDEDPRLTQRLCRYADLLRMGAIPSRAAYELRGLCLEAEGVLSEEALVAEALRILGRKEMKGAYREELSRWVRTGKDVKRLADELILARPFAEALEQARVPLENREVYGAH